MLYLDLDGVFADFNGRFFAITGKHPREVETRRLWQIINSQHDYFESLEFMPGAEELWEGVKEYYPVFLTGAPSRKTFQDQKKAWVAEKFGPEWETIVLPRREKKNYSGPGKVLIDDTEDNIEQWIAAGGHGILYNGDVKKTLETVRAVL